MSTDTSISDKPLHRRRGSRGSQSNQSGSDSDETRTSGGRRKKKDGFSSKIQIPEFGGKKGHPHDVANAFRQWAHCITYNCDYYEDSYLMPLVVSSLTGSLQYEVSINGVKEEIQHVLDSEIARYGQLTPHQMYEVVKKYETYVAHNKRLEGKVPVLTLVTRGLQLRLLAINLTSIKPQPLWHPSKRHQTLICLSWDPLFLKTKTIWEGSQPRKGTKDCSSQASWRRL